MQASHDHPRRADPALGADLLHEGVLQRVAVAEPFHGFYSSLFDPTERDDAGADRRAVDQHRARAALAFAAAFLRAGEAALLAQYVEEPAHWIGVDLGRLSVQREAHAEMISGVAGTSRRSSPKCRSAFTTAGAGPSIGSSPSPLAPKGPPSYRFSSITTSYSGVSSVV